MYSRAAWSVVYLLTIMFVGCNQPSAPALPVAGKVPAKSADPTKPAETKPDNSGGSPQLAAAEAAFVSLVSAAQDSDFESWGAADKVLTESGTEAVPVFAKHLGDDDPFARELATQYLVQLGTGAAAAEKELTAALADTSSMVRVNAAAALLSISASTTAAENVLKELLASEEASVRLPAAISLAGFDATLDDAVAVLTELLAETNDNSIRLTAVQSLGRLGEKAKSSLNAVRMLEGDASADLRTAALQAARQIEGGVDETSETIPVGGVEP